MEIDPADLMRAVTLASRKAEQYGPDTHVIDMIQMQDIIEDFIADSKLDDPA